MTPLQLKLLSAAVVVVATAAGILVPWRMRSRIHTSRGASFLFLSNQFVSGVFLGAALLHLLPEGLESLTRSGFDVSIFQFPICLVAAGIGFFFADFWHNVSSLTSQSSKRERHDSNLSNNDPEITFEVGYGSIDEETPIFPKKLAEVAKPPAKKLGPLVSVLLSIHSFTTGIALGATDRSSDTLALLIAIIAHKSVEAFALCMTLLKERASKSSFALTLLIYSLATPLGILISAVLYASLTGSVMLFLQSLIACFASGNLIYVAVVHMIEHQPDGRFRKSLFPGVLCQVLGFGIMLTVGIWS